MRLYQTPRLIVTVVFLLCVACGFLLSKEPSAPHDSFPVVEIYTVKSGDTFWDIMTRYHSKDCRNLYILEYGDELRRINPILVNRHNQIAPGDKLFIRYHVKELPYAKD